MTQRPQGGRAHVNHSLLSGSIASPNRGCLGSPESLLHKRPYGGWVGCLSVGMKKRNEIRVLLCGLLMSSEQIPPGAILLVFKNTPGLMPHWRRLLRILASRENKSMNRERNQARVLTQGTSDQGQMILLSEMLCKDLGLWKKL